MAEPTPIQQDTTHDKPKQGGAEKAPRSNANAGGKVVKTLHIVFRAKDRVVKSIHPDQPTALLAAQGDLLRPGAEIHGVVEVAFGADIPEAIDDIIAKAIDDHRGAGRAS
jgi:hypothetical protein